MACQDSEAERDRQDKQGAGSKTVLWESRHDGYSTAETSYCFHVMRLREHIKGIDGIKRIATGD
jgi:hypothetical protein